MQGGFPFASSITSEGSMTDITAPLHGSADLGASSHKPKLDTPPNPLALILFFGFLGAGVLFVAYSLYVDVDASGMRTTTYLPYLFCSSPF
jgi:PiT family inorganic phosphate transporter